LSAILNSHTLFQAQPESSIWKLLCSPEGILVGEERNSHTRETSLFAYDLQTQSLLWSGVALAEKWWLNIVDVTKTSLYIQHYAEGPLPTPSGVTSLDLRSGSIGWSEPRVSYFAEFNSEVILLQQGMLQEQYLAVDAATGEHLRRVDPIDLPRRDPDEFTHLTFPSIIDPAELASGEVQRILAPMVLPDDLRGSIEFLKLPNTSILSYYSRDTKDAQAMLDNKLVQDLAIVETATDQVLFSERIMHSANYPVSGSYFLYHDQLLYVKDGSELRSIALA
jgi:hypothetical protein